MQDIVHQFSFLKYIISLNWVLCKSYVSKINFLCKPLIYFDIYLPTKLKVCLEFDLSNLGSTLQKYYTRVKIKDRTLKICFKIRDDQLLVNFCQ